MSEKATLLTSIPPVSKSEPVKKTSLLTPVDSSSSEPSSLLKPINQSSKAEGLLTKVDNNNDDSGAQVKNLNVVVAEASEPVIEEVVAPVEPVETVEAAEVVAVDSSDEAVADGGSGMVGVVSIVLVLCLVGVAVFVFLRKSKGGEVANTTGAGDRKANPTPKAQSTAGAQQGADPIIEFLNKEDAGASDKAQPSTPIKAVDQTPAGTPPPPHSKKPKPPARPASSKPVKPAPNAPAQIKAPSKPKKRF